MEVLVQALVVLAAFNALTRLIPDALWEKLPAWLVATLRILRSFGPEPVKGTKNLGVLIAEFAKAIDGFLSAFRPPPAAALAFIAMTAACAPAKDVTRYAARGGVLTVAYAVQVADEICQDKATEIYIGDKPKAISIAEKCDHGYETARHALLFAAKAIDTWDDGGKQNVACALADGVSALHEIQSTVEAVGGKIPKEIVEDAYKAADVLIGLGGECKK